MKPLAGLTVLDFTRVYSGPYATLLLSDLGARVIKVEHPVHGDDSRSFGPFAGERSTYFETLNRGKQSIAVDLRTAEGQRLLRSLATQCDVVIENFRPGVLARYGLGYATLSREHPALVYASLSGFGADSSRGCYDIVAQAESGLMAATGLPDLPLKAAPPVGDAVHGLTGAVGVLAALWQAARAGRGAHVEVAMVEALFAVLENTLAAYTLTGEVPRRRANQDGVLAPFDCFQTADGWVVIAVGNDALWQPFAALIDPGLARDPRFASNEGRVANYPALRPRVAAWCAALPSGDLLDRLHAAGIPAGAVRAIDELAVDPRLEARSMLVDLGDAVFVPGSPLRLNGQPVTVADRAPRLGEHTAAVIEAFAV